MNGLRLSEKLTVNLLLVEAICFKGDGGTIYFSSGSTINFDAKEKTKLLEFFDASEKAQAEALKEHRAMVEQQRRILEAQEAQARGTGILGVIPRLKG